MTIRWDKLTLKAREAAQAANPSARKMTFEVSHASAEKPAAREKRAAEASRKRSAG